MNRLLEYVVTIFVFLTTKWNTLPCQITIWQCSDCDLAWQCIPLIALYFCTCSHLPLMRLKLLVEPRHHFLTPVLHSLSVLSISPCSDHFSTHQTNVKLPESSSPHPFWMAFSDCLHGRDREWMPPGNSLNQWLASVVCALCWLSEFP